MNWKPTKYGTYLLNGEVVKVRMKGKNNDIPYIYIGEGHYNNLVNDGPWSLLAPDWQKGPPALEQLKKWPWWAVQWQSGLILVDCTDDNTRENYAVDRFLSFSTRPITRSAPVQRDATNGPLWVPMEATK